MRRIFDVFIALIPGVAAVSILTAFQLLHKPVKLPAPVVPVAIARFESLEAHYLRYGKGFILPTTITSSPATSSGFAPRSFTFAIPAMTGGPISSATWTATYSTTGSGFNDDLIKTPSQTSIQGPHMSPYSGTLSVGASAGQISDITAAAGSNLTVTFNHSNPGWSDNITAFTLDITYTPVDWGTPTPDGFNSNRRRLSKIIHGR